VSTLSPAQEETVTRAIAWALTEPVIGLRLDGTDSGTPDVRQRGTAVPISSASGSVSARCLFCGAPGSRLCCDCDDLPALDYLQ
jgi:hypothetical protein